MGFEAWGSEFALSLIEFKTGEVVEEVAVVWGEMERR